jgi:hypothetical protein
VVENRRFGTRGETSPLMGMVFQVLIEAVAKLQFCNSNLLKMHVS